MRSSEREEADGGGRRIVEKRTMVRVWKIIVTTVLYVVGKGRKVVEVTM